MTEQLDKTITAISQWIQEQFEQGYVSGDINLPEMTKALAELVSARAAINEKGGIKPCVTITPESRPVKRAGKNRRNLS